MSRYFLPAGLGTVRKDALRAYRNILTGAGPAVVTAIGSLLNFLSTVTI